MPSGQPFGSHGYIVVEGPIGVGKTTLVNQLAELARSRVILEIFEENPFLADFYQDRGKYAFQTELFFLLSRFRQQQQITQQSLFAEVTLSDYLFHKNLIFSGLTLEDAEWALYLDVYEALSPQVVTPDLVVVLDAPLDILLARIRERGRSYEKDFDADYLEELVHRYRREFRLYDRCPVLMVNTRDIDLRDAEAVSWLVGKIACTTEGNRRI